MNNTAKPTQMNSIVPIVAALALAMVSETVARAGNVVYVDASASPGGDGQSWVTAFISLHDGLAAAVAGNQIWLADGVYKPAPPNGDRNISFVLKNGVELYGGFAGGETSLEERDWEANQTVLSGDLNGDDVDVWLDPSHNENSLVVIRALAGEEVSILDGVRVESGNSSLNGGFGAGFTALCRIQVVRCLFRHNWASSAGGLLSTATQDSTLVDCRFVSNRTWQGRAGASLSAADGLQIVRCQFEHNIADFAGALGVLGDSVMLVDCEFDSNSGLNNGTSDGGAVYTNAAVTLNRCSFTNNYSDGPGGALIVVGDLMATDCDFSNNVAIGAGGALYSNVFFAVPVIKLAGCTFRGNRSEFSSGGAVYSLNHTASIINCIFTGNSSVERGGAIWLEGPGSVFNCTINNNSSEATCGGVAGEDVDLRNTILWSNSGSLGSGELAQVDLANSEVNYCAIQGWTGSIGGHGNHGFDPLFMDADGRDDIIGTDDDDLHLSAGSPCIDTGDPLMPPDVPLDLDGLPRLQACVVDMGVYEIPAPDPTLPDCNKNGIGDTCEVAALTVPDCNFNVVPDACDISSGYSADNDVNGIPDECQGPPANDSCTPHVIMLGGSVPFSTVQANSQGPDEPAGCGFVGDGQIGSDVWFRYPAQCDGLITVGVCGANFDARLAVYIGCPLESGHAIACSDDYCGTSPQVAFPNVGGSHYRIRIGGANGATGSGTLVVTCQPAPACEGDADGSGEVDIDDLLLVIGDWGTPPPNLGDVNVDGVVNIDDLLEVIGNWGACP